MTEESTRIAERLVATVARAFYTDNFVVLFDALVREKYIRQEELGPRLKLPNEEVRKMVVQLESEKLITYEERLMESDLRRSQCYYIDYQYFVHAVRYRIHLMQKCITTSENLELNRHFMLCPTCKTKFSELEYYKVRDKDNVFICPYCCPLLNYRTIKSEKYYQLVDYDRTEKVNEVQSLASKFKRQFGRSDGHEGIYELLAQLKDVPITRNLPSDNIERGIVASRVTDADVQNEIDYNNIGIKAKKLTKQQKSYREKVAAAGDLKVEFASEKSSQGAVSGLANGSSLKAGSEPEAKRARTLPEFLQGSRIISNDPLVETAVSLRNKESEISVGTASIEKADDHGNKVEEKVSTQDDDNAMEDEEDIWED